MDQPAHYEIRVGEHLDALRAKWFHGLQISHTASGESTLAGEMTDQPALFGTLLQVRDLGLTLISVKRLERDPLISHTAHALDHTNENTHEGR